MSNYFNVHCVTCGDTQLLDCDTNWREDVLARLVAERGTLEAIARLLRLVDTDEVLGFWGPLAERLYVAGTAFDPQWFLVHAGHHLLVRGEYIMQHEGTVYFESRG